METGADKQRWGLTLPLPMTPLRDHADHVRRTESAGYTDLWSGETNGPDGFTNEALVRLVAVFEQSSIGE